MSKFGRSGTNDLFAPNAHKGGGAGNLTESDIGKANILDESGTISSKSAKIKKQVGFEGLVTP
jgi:hypothetical protein